MNTFAGIYKINWMNRQVTKVDERVRNSKQTEYEYESELKTSPQTISQVQVISLVNF